MAYKQGDIVVVSFPFADSTGSKPRPALVISGDDFNASHQHTILAMITTGAKTRWDSDIKITQLESTGLSVPSLIRMKLFTLDERLIRNQIGMLASMDKEIVMRSVKSHVF
jgi:mRNA interferase MazF